MPRITPVNFAKNKLKLTMWNKFSALFEAVQSGKRRILVRSANGVGKTTALAALCNWKLSTHKECIVLTTSSSEKQLKHNLWGEIRKQAALAGLYDPKDITNTRIKLDEKRFMVAVNPAKPESAQGYHAASILIAIDEATGVRRDIISSLIATATGDDVLVVMIYNPMSEDSYAFEAEQSGEWEVITISALEHPNITKNKNLIPGAVTVRSTEERLALWSEPTEPNSPDAFEFKGKWWRKTHEVCRRILGEWHSGLTDGLFSQDLIASSLIIQPQRGITVMGVDVGGGGRDETIIARFDGNIQLPFITVHSANYDDIVRAIAAEYNNGFKTIAIDETGMVARLTPVLAARGINAKSVKFSQSPTRLHDTRERKLANARMEMYYNLFDEMHEGRIRLLDDAKLHAELRSMRISQSETERYFLEKKEKIKSRLGRSPDRADATALARYALLTEWTNFRPLLL